MNIMLNYFRKKKPEAVGIKQTDLREDKLDTQKLSSLLLGGLNIFRVLKPFHRITKTGSYTTFDVYPAFKTAKKKQTIEEITYKDEADLASIINAEFSKTKGGDRSES